MMKRSRSPLSFNVLTFFCFLFFLSRGASAEVVAAGSMLRAEWIKEDLEFSLRHRTGGDRQEGRKVNQEGVTTSQDAAGGCDGIKNGKWGFHTASGEENPWWQVDLGKCVSLDRVVIFNRTDSGCASRTKNIQVQVSTDVAPCRFTTVYRHKGTIFYGIKEKRPLIVDLKEKNVTARIVRLAIPHRLSFALDEVEIYGIDDPKANLALNRAADQKSVGPYSYPSPTAEQGAPDRCDFSLAHTKEVLQRAKQLAERLRAIGAGEDLGPLLAQWNTLEKQRAALEKEKRADQSVRRTLYMQARLTARSIAFCNPLLDFDKLLFIKRHDSKGVFHMCDQYYGFNAVPGGGIFVLTHPFGRREPATVCNLLENSVVGNGRFKGRQLEPGSFLSPELSFDGTEILFAYTQAVGKALEWTKESCHHIFSVRSDGTSLRQLTDGPHDDFDPCFLPDGRVVFVSERCGGYLRCGRHCPTYTLFSMDGDGGSIEPLSHHETHEWHPSVDHNGMLVYTRWDYVDRDTNVAHHIWTSYPDGRDPRSFHGNYPERRESRPWMEMSIRAVPGSHKYVATAGAHHGHAFGSLVLIDPWELDDGAMSQLERLTPDVPFPEAERHIRSIRKCMVYGTPWPLSEDDYLCVYGSDAKNRGIYWIDRFGNKELIYRDPGISCLSPIPLRPRPKPPVIPDHTGTATKLSAYAAPRRTNAAPSVALHTVSVEPAASPPLEGTVSPLEGTVSILNIYEGDFQWPEATTITHLRIIQLLPKTTAPPNDPRIGIGNQTNARAVLGTVPVEQDGSVFFSAPAGKQIYFQALNKQGFTVQSMRSGTYLAPGEHLSCQGCHEPKHRTPYQYKKMPRAFQRPPSPITPDAAGSNPFSYVRLVQPVLDRNCVSCHQKEKALDLTGKLGGSHGWSRSYTNLAGKYGFYFHVTNGSIKQGIHGGSRSIPGGFGALVSPLLPYLTEEHCGKPLSHDDLHRITLWLDCNSEFYGSYENTKAQARGEVVYPTLD